MLSALPDSLEQANGALNVDMVQALDACKAMNSGSFYVSAQQATGQPRSSRALFTRKATSVHTAPENK